MQNRFVLASLVLLLALVTTEARAQRVRLHGTLDGARAVGGHQTREMPWGGAMFIAGELPLVPQFGIQIEAGGLLMGKGDQPSNPLLESEGGAHAVFGAVGMQTRPFAHEDIRKVDPLSGIWASTDLGATTTGGRTRILFDAHLGFDFMLEQGKFGLGPTVGLVHVFQSDDDIRPADANIILFGVHGVYDNAKPPEPVDNDRDRDLILNERDKCPDSPEDRDGFEDEDGCPENDNDKDGILDVADHCPLTPEDKDGFEDEDGCPEEDNDKDGVFDVSDKCPNDPEDKDEFEDEDGCPDKDNDQDSILDPDDLCPNEPETKNGYADHDGCPDEEQIRVVGDKILLDDSIHFRTNNAVIRPESYPLMKRLAKLLMDHPEYLKIEIQGHTDNRGDEKFNQKLSEDRAASVLEFLVERGVERDRLSSSGFGSSRPVSEEDTEHARYLNRRVELVITRIPPDAAKKLEEQGVAPGTVVDPPSAPAPTQAPAGTDGGGVR